MAILNINCQLAENLESPIWASVHICEGVAREHQPLGMLWGHYLECLIEVGNPALKGSAIPLTP